MSLKDLQKVFLELDLLRPLDDVSDSLIDSKEMWVKFDHLAMLPLIKEVTISILNSVDTLFLEDTTEKIDFIEFKDQPLNNVDIPRIARKAVFSLKILKILMTNYELEFSKIFANNYVLVYSNVKTRNRLNATEAILRRRNFYFLQKRLVIDRKLYKQVLLIGDKSFIERYNIRTTSISDEEVNNITIG